MQVESDLRSYPVSKDNQHHVFLRKIQEACNSSCELICFLPLRLSLVSHHHNQLKA